MQGKSISRLWQLSLLLFVGVLISLTVIRCAQRPQHFVSLSSDVKYTGDASCESCHQKIYDSYKQTGMGRSLYQPDTSEIIEDFSSQALVFDQFSAYYYQPFFRKNELFIREFQLKGTDTTYQRIEKIDYIVGSGHQTRSYLQERNGYLYEAPITWYVSKQLWDLSPGYDAGNNSRFSREIGEACLACHTGNFEYVEGSKHRYREISMGIDCERCHGPGEVHVQAMLAGDEIDVGELTDYTIVNPAKLPLDKRFDVCQQCHLQGVNVLKDGKSVRDFRPGMYLKDVYHVFLEKNEDQEAFGIASHAERLQQSQCFLQSEGKLTCTTCHDPHKSIAITDNNIYVRQCQQCHQPTKQIECGLDPQAQMLEQGNCISCHMPKGGTSDIPHVSFHDHKIRVVDTTQRSLAAEKAFVKSLFCANDASVTDSSIGAAYLQRFEEVGEIAQDLAQAKSLLGTQGNLYERARVALYEGKLSQANVLIKQAITTQGEQPLLLFLQGEIAEAAGNYSLAYRAYLKAWQQNPAAFEAGLKAGTSLLQAKSGQLEALTEAQQIFDKLYKQKPFEPRLLTNMGFVALNQGRFDQSEIYLVKSLKVVPNDIQALENMIFLQLAKGNSVRARMFYERLLQAKPDYDPQRLGSLGAGLADS